jgi:hypothetical protein
LPFSSEYFDVTPFSYERVTWSVRDEHNLRVFAERVLRRIFEQMRDEETE